MILAILANFSNNSESSEQPEKDDKLCLHHKKTNISIQIFFSWANDLSDFFQLILTPQRYERWP